MRGYRMGLAVLLTACGIGLVPPLQAERDARKLVADLPGDPDAGLPMEVLDPAEESQLSVLAGGSCELVADPPTLAPTSSSVIRGNAFRILRPSDLTEIQMELNFGSVPAPVQASASFSIHKNVGTSASPIWEHFWSQSPAITLSGTGRKFYASGPITPPPLAMGVEYYIGLTWGSVPIQYFRDSTMYPQPFSDGLVLGSAGTGIPTGPPVDPATDFFFPPFASAAYSMQLCISPKQGACCNGSICSYVLESTCLAMGGSYSEDLLTCAQLQQSTLGCPLATGACCIGESCSVQDGFQCERFGGEWQRAVACVTGGDNPCLPQGACCSPSGTCSEDSEENCLNVVHGVFQGDDTTCAGVGSACQLGACCKDSLCNYVTRATCATNTGLWRGAGTDCDGDLCDPTGACCDGDQCIGGEAVTFDDCIFMGGESQGDWTSCTSQPTGCELGACCTPEFGCFPDLDVLTCNLLDGIYHDGLSCDQLNPPCAGVCCFGTGSANCLADATPAQCNSLQGKFVGYVTPPTGQFQTICSNNPNPPCPGGAIGRCCLPTTGACFRTDSIGCSEMTGSTMNFQSGGVCSPNICPQPGLPGACCLPNGLCVELIASKCTAEGGVFSGAGIDCTLELCAVGACCPGNGGACINNATVATCNANSGTYFSGETCGAVTCPAIGACCLPNGSCQKITQANCTLMSGIYTINNLNCVAGNLCVRGSCCLMDGSCSSTITLRCTQQGGSFDISSQCSSANACGACCTNGSCAVRTDFLCPSTSIHQGEGTNCLSPTPICGLGTCCARDGTCTDNLTEIECTDVQGLFGRGLSCAANPCPPKGACCQTDSTCGVIIESACASEGGLYQGDNAPCVPADCDRGACCLPLGGCTDVIPADCAAMGGEYFEFDDCANFTCDMTGACCVNGTCQVMTPFGCSAISGVFVGANTSCTAGSCTVGACCDRNGGCTDSIASQCTTAQSVFTSGTDCATSPCVVGACCKEGAATACEILRQSTCTAEGGIYAGNGTDCTQSHCMRGACCTLGQQCARFPGCFGGSNDGTPCTSNAQCTGGGTCTTSRCFGGMNDGTPCTSNAQCTGGGMCFSSGCFGGANDGTPCNSDAQCTGGGTCGVTQFSERYCETMVGAGVAYAGLDCVADDPCSTGACCQLTGCPNVGVRKADCMGPDDQFINGGVCGDFQPVCQVRGACCNGTTCNLETLDGCTMPPAPPGQEYLGDGVSCIGNPCAPVMIVSSTPASQSIDARRPHDVGNALPAEGYNQVDVTFDNDASMLTTADFSMTQAGGDGIPPILVSVTPLSMTVIRLTFATPIDPLAWTIIRHTASNTQTCIGFLPGDVDGNSGVATSDVTPMTANLTTPVLPDYAVDTNRSGVTTSEDLIELMNLLNGADTFDPANMTMLPASPCP